MKTILSIILLLGLQFFTSAQQFVLTAIIEKNIQHFLDIDGDGVCEYIADTNKVYDGSTHLLKYTFPGTLRWPFPGDALEKFVSFPYIDFNGDGNRDLITEIGDFPDEKVYVFDVVGNQIIFEFDPPEAFVDFNRLIDIDGDNILDIIFNADGKAYIYSTGVSVTSVSDDIIEKPNHFNLNQNYPNPFNPSTKIRYSISTPENISIKVYDISGQIVKEIAKEHNQPGEYEIVWDGTNSFGERVSSGVYFYQLESGNLLETKKMMMLK